MMSSSIVVGVEPKSLVNFRGELLRSITAHGFAVTTLSNAPTSCQSDSLKDLGVKSESVVFLRGKLSIIADLKTLVELIKKYKAIKPNFILAYTIKPVIWGGLAAKFCKADFYALITGLGFAFQGTTIKRKLLTKLVVFLYRIALKNSKAVIFQNSDNRDVFIKKKSLSHLKLML